MRWGIQNDAYESHGTYDLCKKEIVNCQKFSIGPNFVVINREFWFYYLDL
jgi:hypothetical protein